MASNSNKFLICIPHLYNRIRNRERSRIVGRAVARMAQKLEADIEVSQEKHLLSVWVYYTNGNDKWTSVYSDYDKSWSEADVLSALSSEMRSLSSRHEHIVLQNA